MNWISNGGLRTAFGLFDVNTNHVGRHILKNVTLELYPGEFHALLGNRNSGKSAIAAAFLGDIDVSSGRIRLAGKEYAHISPVLARKHGVYSVTVSPKVFPRLNVAENLLSGEPSWLQSLRPWRSYVRGLRNWLDGVGIDLPLQLTLDSLPKEDWVFVEIISRLYRSPSVLILDEALERLRPERRNAILPLLGKHMKEGMSILWITHKTEDVLGMADRVSVVRDGKVLLSSKAEGLEHLNLIQLCYAQIEEMDGAEVTTYQFQQLMRFTGALVRDLPQAVTILDPGMVVRFVNRRAQTLFSAAGGGLGRNIDLLLGEQNRDIARKISQSMQNGHDEVWHNVSFRDEGVGSLFDITLRRIREHEKSVGYMLFFEDVSAREIVRRRVILSDNLASIGLLAAGVAHEVNNPLEILGNYLVFLKKKEKDEENKKILRKMEDEAARIQQIANNLVVFSGEVGSDDSVADLRALCLDLCDLLKFHNQDRRIIFVCPPVDFTPTVCADPNEMCQVLLNLFRNSIAVLGDGGRIEVVFGKKLKDGVPVVELKFSDNGPGIGMDSPEDVFLPFVTTRTEGGKNHGLGLFITYGIIEKYGGSIQAENLREGGCLFTITLPLAEK